MPTRNVVLTAHHEALIERLVASGRYQNASEVLRAGLRVLEREDTEYEAKLAALRAAIQVGIDAADRGDVVTFQSSDDMRRYLRQIADTAINGAAK